MIVEKTSANTTANQIPFIPNIIGNTSIAITSNTKVLKNEITADTTPLFKAVKNDDE